MKIFLGISIMAAAAGTSVVRLRQQIARGAIVPDGIVEHTGRKDAVFLPETVETLRAIRQSNMNRPEPICR